MSKKFKSIICSPETHHLLRTILAKRILEGKEKTDLYKLVDEAVRFYYDNTFNELPEPENACEPAELNIPTEIAVPSIYEQNGYLTIEQAMKYTGIARDKIEDGRRKGKLAFIKIGHRFMYSKERLEKFVMIFHAKEQLNVFSKE